MIKPLVFVYGSLRRGGSAHARLRPAGQCLGQASVAGYLYDLGPYPAARPARCPRERVQGELYRLTRPAASASSHSDVASGSSAGRPRKDARSIQRSRSRSGVGSAAELEAASLLPLVGFVNLVYILYKGVPAVLRVPEDRALVFTLALIACAFALNLLVVLVLAAIKAVQTFDEVFVLTGGGPGSATTLVVAEPSGSVQAQMSPCLPAAELMVK